MAEPLDRWNADMAGIADKVHRSLVQVHNGRGRGRAGAGAGTIWHQDGLILTNAHVVRRRHLQVVLPDGRTLPARILAHRADLDLAALGVEAHDLPAIELGDSHELQPGQRVLAVGYPWGIAESVTAGIVTGMGTQLPEMPLSDREWIVVSLHLRPGYSGGPLVDARGRLVGINTIMAGPDLGLAVPAHVVKAFLREAMRR